MFFFVYGEDLHKSFFVYCNVISLGGIFVVLNFSFASFHENFRYCLVRKRCVITPDFVSFGACLFSIFMNSSLNLT